MSSEHPFNITPADAQTAIRALRFYAEHPEYNDDTETATDALARLKMNLSSVYGKLVNVPAPRTEDWTTRELFGNQIGEDRNGRTIKECLECGSLVTKHSHHTSWHNKLLP